MVRRIGRYFAERKLGSQRALTEKYYGEVQAMYRQMRTWRHDYKNHLQVMKAHLDMGEYRELSDYIRRLDEELTSIGKFIETGNLALDAILNQKGKDVVCVYVAIGQKTGSVAQIVENLSRRGAMEYTAVVSACAGDSAALQYIAPYAGCALAEHFMYQGDDVLIVYDDLSKHAIAYRALSLLLERSPGREAYPGDVFYLHSRLLERSAHLSDELGGGSMTALPIVETQAGDVSAYIPTNIISITDGQIFLEGDLFFSGQRPAVNVGLSVSRVGGDAQTRAMKSAAGAIRLELAQYREMEVFTQFSSDLDDATKRQLTYGQGLMRLLRQPQYAPFSQHQQVVILVSALGHIMQDVPLERMDSFRAGLLDHVEENGADLCSRIDLTGQLSPEDREEILDLARDYLARFQAGGKQGG